MALSLATYLYDANKLSREDFLKKYPSDVLVVEPYAQEEEPQLSTAAGGEFSAGVAMVYRIENKAGHGFGDRVTLGRTGNNDVPIQAPDVSKYHGYLTRDGDSYAYTDADSTYGSKVNGEVVSTGDKVHIPCGGTLEIASVRMTLYSAEGLYGELCRTKPEESL